MTKKKVMTKELKDIYSKNLKIKKDLEKKLKKTEDLTSYKEYSKLYKESIQLLKEVNTFLKLGLRSGR